MKIKEENLEELAKRLEEVREKILDPRKQITLELTMSIYLLMLLKEKCESGQFYILGIIAGMLQGIAWQDDGTLQNEVEGAVYALNALKREMMKEGDEE